MPAKENTKEKKYSVWFALGAVTLVSVVDLIQNSSVAATQNLSIALIAFAAARQTVKSVTGR